MIKEFFANYKKLSDIEGDFIAQHMDTLEEEELREPFDNDDSEYNQLIKKVDKDIKKIKTILEWLECQKDILPLLRFFLLEFELPDEDYDNLNKFIDEFYKIRMELKDVSKS